MLLDGAAALPVVQPVQSLGGTVDVSGPQDQLDRHRGAGAVGHGPHLLTQDDPLSDCMLYTIKHHA